MNPLDADEQRAGLEAGLAAARRGAERAARRAPVLEWTHTTEPRPFTLFASDGLPLTASDELMAEWNERNTRAGGSAFSAAYTHTASRNGPAHLAPADDWPRP